MAVVFQDLKIHIQLVLYDYMLTSDHESFWFNIPEIREALPEEASGAFVNRALDALIAQGMVEKGVGEDSATKADVPVYALTQQGIQEAERLLEERGQKVRLYSPAPSIDRILSRIHDRAVHDELEAGFKELSEVIRSNNVVSTELGDDKDLIEAEVGAARDLTSKERFRVARLAALIIPTLRYLADKFFGQGVGELAKRLIDLLMSLT